MNLDSDVNFYRHFEERFRGSRDNIKQRLRCYEPLLTFLKLQPQQLQGQQPRALDLGCGRGEWLELLIEAGFDAQGVDLDDGMLVACRERGLPAVECDALAALQRAPDNSLSLVSAFHMVEHIEFDLLLALTEQAQRALAPGGILLMETPNPENLSVGTSSFYLDPTHSKPIPHALLAFVTKYKGFAAHRTVRVNEPYKPLASDPILLQHLLFSVSPDYAVVAIKDTTPERITAFRAAIPTPSGIALDEIAYKYDEQMTRRLVHLEGELARVSIELQRCLSAPPSLTTRLGQALRRIPRVLKRMYRGAAIHGMRGLWLPFQEYFKANPMRSEALRQRLERWKLHRLAQALCPQVTEADAVTATEPTPSQTLPPSVQAIEGLVLSELSRQTTNRTEQCAKRHEKE